MSVSEGIEKSEALDGISAREVSQQRVGRVVRVAR